MHTILENLMTKVVNLVKYEIYKFNSTCQVIRLNRKHKNRLFPESIKKETITVTYFMDIDEMLSNTYSYSVSGTYP